MYIPVTFVKGVAANPGGKPKYPKIVAMMRAATPEIVQGVIDMALDKDISPGVRLACSQEIVNRVIGRPVQRTENETNIHVSIERQHLDALITISERAVVEEEPAKAKVIEHAPQAFVEGLERPRMDGANASKAAFAERNHVEAGKRFKRRRGSDGR